jgi:hypothetical protein
MVSCHINFDSILGGLDPGKIDERTLRLYRMEPDGSQVEESIQFNSDNQKRYPGRQLQGGIPENVSWGGAWSVDKIPDDLRVSGNISWIARGVQSGVSRYRLFFGVPNDGIYVQVPFPPDNLRYFDTQGRAKPVYHFPRMQIRPQWALDGVIHVLRDGDILTSYHIGATDLDITKSAARRPYFYPVNGPDGISLTELGKPHDPTGSHAHHYSLWVAHDNIAGHNFWSERGGRIYHDQFELMDDGALFAKLIQKNRWVIEDKALLRERRILTFYATPDNFRLIDVELELLPGGAEPVELGKTPFGFLAARVAQSMTVFDGGGEIINSSGQRNEHQAHWQHARWIDQSGPIAHDKWGGVALFDHPENPNYPTAWHCRNDGWAGASFNLDQTWKIDLDNPLRLHYRVYLHRHDANGGNVHQKHKEYTCKPEIRIEKAHPY